MAIDVFLSIGRTTNATQELFVSAVERCLMERDLRPRTLGRNEWSSEQPLRAIKKRMEACSGTAIIAFERLHINHGTDLSKTGEAAAIRGRGLPTTWNQIEAAMAYTIGHPLLVIVEEGVISEGLLEARYDWMVEWVPLDPEALRQPQCAGIISDWRDRVADFHKTRRQLDGATARGTTSIADKTVGQLMG